MARSPREYRCRLRRPEWAAGPKSTPYESAQRDKDAVAHAPPRHEGKGLDDDGAGHLRLAPQTIGERDRMLDHPLAEVADVVGHLDLEAVAVGPDRFEMLELTVKMERSGTQMLLKKTPAYDPSSMTPGPVAASQAPARSDPP